jgi:hypothetical protein
MGEKRTFAMTRGDWRDASRLIRRIHVAHSSVAKPVHGSPGFFSPRTGRFIPLDLWLV